MKEEEKHFLLTIRICLAAVIVILAFLSVLMLPLLDPSALQKAVAWTTRPPDSKWSAPDSLSIKESPNAELIHYGQELVAHTSRYLGPQGTVASISNGMNCQNCHLQVGKKIFGNNFSAVASTYPKFRARSGTVESVEKRINDCIERSLNGTALDTASMEMKGIAAYIRWVGKDVPKGKIPHGAGIADVPLLSRAANPDKGKEVYESNCARCHGTSGVRHPDGKQWLYPPLWGSDSYNTGAGIFRISRLAGYIKMNMPNEGGVNRKVLSDEEAWDVAAYINSMPRPTKDIAQDWPELSTKPFDHPFGPYADGFSEAQHKYGPFQPILDAHKK